LNDPDLLDPASPVDEDLGVRGAVRFLVLVAVVLILPLVLMAAAMTVSASGCGGG
jgi:hypothetical protein